MSSKQGLIFSCKDYNLNEMSVPVFKENVFKK